MIIFCSLMNSVPPILWDISHRTSINNSMPEIPKGAQLVYEFLTVGRTSKAFLEALSRVADVLHELSS